MSRVNPVLTHQVRVVFAPGSTLPPHQILSIARGVASLMAHLHDRGVNHGDLYAHNILIDRAGSPLKGDFGAASLLDGFSPDRRDSLQRLEVRAYGCLLDDLLGLSLLVEGTACNWTGDLVRGGRALRRSYGAFARGGSSDYRFASVELSESQRRAFLDRAEEALHLAERARLTFEALGLDDERARAAGAHALALTLFAEAGNLPGREALAGLPVFSVLRV